MNPKTSFYSVLAVLLPILFLVEASADPVVILGSHWHTNGSLEDKVIMRRDICRGIESAKKAGHTVTLLAPAVECHGVVYKSDCAKGECKKDEIKAHFKKIAASIPPGKTPNLVIQTVGHGGYGGIEQEDSTIVMGDSGTPESEYSARDLAEAINQSGIAAKVGRIHGVFFQCYSGGFHSLAKMVKPMGKLCGMAQATHNLEANVTLPEREKLEGGSAFIAGFWQRIEQGGKPTLKEAMMNSIVLQREVNSGTSMGERWRTTSDYLARKGLKEAEFDLKDQRRLKVLETLGYDTPRIKEQSNIQELLNAETEEAIEIANSYRRGAKKVNEFNNSFASYFWADDTYEEDIEDINRSVCYRAVNLKRPNIDNLWQTIQELDSKFDKQSNPEGYRFKESLKKRVAGIKKDMGSLEDELRKERAAFSKRLNALLEKSKRVMEKSYPEQGEVDISKRMDYQKEYESVLEEIKNLKGLEQFPTLQKMMGLEAEAANTIGLLRAMNSPDIDQGTKKQIRLSYECEHSPIFSEGN